MFSMKNLWKYIHKQMNRLLRILNMLFHCHWISPDIVWINMSDPGIWTTDTCSKFVYTCASKFSVLNLYVSYCKQLKCTDHANQVYVKLKQDNLKSAIYNMKKSMMQNDNVLKTTMYYKKPKSTKSASHLQHSSKKSNSVNSACNVTIPYKM